MALLLPLMLGITALSVDASFMYDKRNQLYAAADAAAKSAALEVRRGNTNLANLQAFADHQVAVHGFSPGTTTSVVVHNPPASGPFTGNANFVEVIVSEPTSTFFGHVLGIVNMTPGARAVAGIGSGPECIMTLGVPGSDPPSMSLGNSILTLPSCEIADGGDLVTTNPNAAIDAMGISVGGVCSGNGCANMPNMSTDAPAPEDPLAGLPAPPNPGGCVAVTNPTAPLTPGCYSSIVAQGTLTFAGPGVFYVTGPILIDHNTTVTSTGGILLYLAGSAATAPCTAAATAGCINVANHGVFKLSAMTSGPYNGILFFQDPANHLNAQFDGNNPTYSLSGAMYFPGADVSFRNGLNAVNDCMLFVARSLYISNGNGAFNNTCAAYGGSPIQTVTLVE